jgi:heme exporter protein D
MPGVSVGPSRSKQRRGWVKWVLLAVGVALAAMVALLVATVTGHHTDCYADFRSKEDAERVLAASSTEGLDDTDLIANRHHASLDFFSGETGGDAAEFRQTVKHLVRSGGGHMEKNTPCIERPYFD